MGTVGWYRGGIHAVSCELLFTVKTELKSVFILM